MFSFRSATRAVALASLGLPYVFGKYYGVCYDSNNRDEKLIRQDFLAMKESFAHIRVYSPVAGNVQYAKLAQEVGVNVLIGISGENGDGELQQLCESVKAYPTNIDAISVGNENIGYRGAQFIIGLIHQVRECLQGLPIPITSVQRNGDWENHSEAPALAQEVDLIAANTYTFFNTQGATDASGFVAQLDELIRKFPGKEIWVSETGYPSCGTNKEGQPASIDLEAQYFFGVFAARPEQVIYYFMFNDANKPGENYESCFGINDVNGNPKFNYGSNNPGNTTPAVNPQPAPAPVVPAPGAPGAEAPVVPGPPADTPVVPGATGAEAPGGQEQATPTSGNASQYPPKAC